MKKLLLTFVLALTVCLAKAQTHSWQKLADLGDDIPTRYQSQMVSYNGKLYFFGGYGYASGGTLYDFWEYNPQTGVFTKQTSPFDAGQPYNGVAITIGDSMWYVLAGSIYQYNFLTKTWANKGYKSEIPASKATVFAVGTNLYIIGSNKFLCYDTSTGQLNEKTPYPIYANASVNVASRFAFNIGTKGYIGTTTTSSSGNNALQHFYEYDITNDTWIQRSPHPAPHISASAIGVNGKGYVGAVGNIGTPSTTGAFFEYDAVTDTWASKTFGAPVTDAPIASPDNDNIFIFSGRGMGSGGPYSTSSIWKYNITSNSWTTEKEFVGGGRKNPFGLYYNNKIYLGGGDDVTLRNDTWELDLLTNSWTKKADKPTSYTEQGHATLNGKAYLFGGYCQFIVSHLAYSKDVLCYDAATDSWSTKAEYPGEGVRGLGAFVVGNNIYVGGGANVNGTKSNFYKYDTDLNAWTQLASAMKAGVTVGSFAIGTIGYFIYQDGTMYAYDTVTNTWTQKSSPGGTSNEGTTNCFVKDGYGYYLLYNGTTSANSIKRYDQSSNTWTTYLDATFNRKNPIIISGNNDVYIGMGIDYPVSRYKIINDLYKLNFEAPVSTYLGSDISSDCALGTGTASNRTFFDSEGGLFIATINNSSGGNFCHTQRSLSGSYREQLIRLNGNSTTYGAMFMNKNFTLNSSSIFMSGASLRTYFTDAELTAFVNAFNSKYGTSKTVSDIQIVGISGANSGYPNYDLDPLNNVGSPLPNYTAFATTVNNYKTADKYLQTTFTSGQGGEFYVILATPATTLPVSITDFNASLKTNGALLTWSAASELNNKHFIVEKSTDGATFSPIATIEGKGTTYEQSNYQFTDVNFFQSAYYRLTQVDLNGTKRVYDEMVRHVKSLAETDKISVYPNPTSALVFVKSTDVKNGLSAKLLDVNGKVLQSKSTKGQVLEFNLASLPLGMYIVQSTDDKGTHSEKIIKK